MSTNHRNIEATSMKNNHCIFCPESAERSARAGAALGGIGIDRDVGHGRDVCRRSRAYVAHAQLQNYANAAVLAAAGLVYNTSSTNNATTEANLYSGSSGMRTSTMRWHCNDNRVDGVPELAAAERDYLPSSNPPRTQSG